MHNENHSQKIAKLYIIYVCYICDRYVLVTQFLHPSNSNTMFGRCWQFPFQNCQHLVGPYFHIFPHEGDFFGGHLWSTLRLKICQARLPLHLWDVSGPLSGDLGIFTREGSPVKELADFHGDRVSVPWQPWGSRGKIEANRSIFSEVCINKAGIFFSKQQRRVAAVLFVEMEFFWTTCSSPYKDLKLKTALICIYGCFRK